MSQNINATPRILFGLQIAPRCMNGQDPRPLFWYVTHTKQTKDYRLEHSSCRPWSQLFSLSDISAMNAFYLP